MIFGIDIATTVADAFTGQLLPATLTREVTGAYNPVTDRLEDEEGSPVEPGTQTYTSEGIVEAYSEDMIAAGLVTEKHRKILLLAKPLETEPKAGDEIQIEGQAFTVTGVPERDPATATWTVRGEL